MPATEWGWLVTPEELRSWTLHDSAGLLVVNKPGGLLCHPSKCGPWSSLIGAAREYLALPRLHMPSRLDRETSGVVVLAKTSELGSRLQRAMMERRVEKSYLAVLDGILGGEVVVDQPIGPAAGSRVHVRRAVVEGGTPARTRFLPLAVEGGLTLAEVIPETGRLHQIRVHAQWLGCPVLADKIYGSDEALYLEFRERGWTENLARALPLRAQALHAARWRFADLCFEAPVPEDWRRNSRIRSLITSAFGQSG